MRFGYIDRTIDPPTIMDGCLSFFVDTSWSGALLSQTLTMQPRGWCLSLTVRLKWDYGWV
jgi:hypothetical protein